MLSSKQIPVYLLFISSLITTVEGHGYLKTPRSRNWVAQEDGVTTGGDANDGKPEQDFCPHCLNSKASNNLCSKGNAATLYDHWLDINGNPMPWISQATYQEGQEITVESVLTTNHAGHMDMYLCPDGENPDQDCMWDNPLTLIRDELYGGPTDSTYPERAYFKNDAYDFKFTYKLPEGVCGEKVLIQWRYITANSCFPPGYRDTEVADELQDLGWLRASGMSDCIFPYDPTGATGSGMPEQFWNCAEISIECTDPTISPAPTQPPVPTPEVTSPPVPAPTDPPGPTPGYCSYSGIWDTSREECDGIAEGGPWCNENEGQCTGSCNGNWCLVPVTSPPTEKVTASPTEYTTEAPTPSPSAGPSATPTIQSTPCVDDPDEEYFLKFKDDGTPVFKTCGFLADSEEKKINNHCTKKTDSHDGVGPAGEVCKELCGYCPSSSPTDRPTKSPTATPTEKVTAPPTTKAPTKAPTVSTEEPTASPTGEVCCSQFFDICKDNPWCQESVENCITCNGVFLPDLPKTCIPRFGMCSLSDGDNGGCCYPSTCVSGTTGGDSTQGQCMYYPPE